MWVYILSDLNWMPRVKQKLVRKSERLFV